MMKPITQEECLKIFFNTPYPRGSSDKKYLDRKFVLRFLFLLNSEAKRRGYRLFSWTDYAISEIDIAGSYILCNIEELSREIIIKNENRNSKRY